ncbi:hypothetical protein [uncultured Rothia sp.]|uniref:hypothetical protein n=1 Tax=uncultured Rothia sp. TaxID=316088 RepID=UPI0028E9E9BC|nr:hypothetical protein [uncultured Rothia sp.]
MDNLGFQKELEVIHSHLFEIFGHIFQKYRSGADSTRHIRAGSSHGHHPALPPGYSAAAHSHPPKAVNQALN